MTHDGQAGRERGAHGGCQPLPAARDRYTTVAGTVTLRGWVRARCAQRARARGGQQTEVAAFRSNVEGLKIGPTSDTTYMFKVSKR